MKVLAFGQVQIFHRYLTPRWAFDPLSGAGAARDGGRFNRPGSEALYLSADPGTALAEYAQGASIPPPATYAAYKVRLSHVIDFSAGPGSDAFGPEWAGWDSDWRHIWRIERTIPPSWHLADAALSAGAAGLLFPSTWAAGGTNLVIFPANVSSEDVLAVHDPDNRLPRDQRSWPSA